MACGRGVEKRDESRMIASRTDANVIGTWFCDLKSVFIGAVFILVGQGVYDRTALL